MKRKLLSGLYFILSILPVFCSHLCAAEKSVPRAVPTFECLGLYYPVDQDNPGECAVH